MNIIKHSEELIKYNLDLNINLSNPQTRHLLNLVTGVINIDGSKNISNLNRSFFYSTNRSNLSRFLTHSPWDEEEVNSKRLEYSYNKVLKEAEKSNEPIFFSIDDTLITKKRNSKKIEGMTSLFSHVTGKSEWSHCQVALQAKSGNFSIPLNFKIYFSKDYCEKDKIDFKSKNDLAVDLIDDLKLPLSIQCYLLVDKWYASYKLIMDMLSRGIHTIVPLKSNRKFFPKGIEASLKEYEKIIDKTKLRPLNINGEEYFVYRYEGNLKDIENAVILFSYKVENGELKPPVYLLSTDISLSNRQIISYYKNRWDLEVSFRYQKDSLGLKDYQMRSIKGIKRYWYIIYLAYNFLSLKQLDNNDNLGNLILKEKQEHKKYEILKIIELKEEGKKTCEILDLFIKKVA